LDERWQGQIIAVMPPAFFDALGETHLAF